MPTGDSRRLGLRRHPLPCNLANAVIPNEPRARVGGMQLLGLVLLLGLSIEGRCQETSGSSFAILRPQPTLSQAPPIGAAPSGPAQPTQPHGPAESKAEPFLIDLPTAFRLADVQNLQIQFARERIRAAEAEL